MSALKRHQVCLIPTAASVLPNVSTRAETTSEVCRTQLVAAAEIVIHWHIRLIYNKKHDINTGKQLTRHLITINNNYTIKSKLRPVQ